MRKLLRSRNARIYLLGDVVSTLGDSALWLAMAIWVKELTSSSAWAGLVFFFFALGNLTAPLGGVVADRFRRRPLLIWCNLLGAALVLLVLFVQGRGQIWVIFGVIFLYGVLGAVINPAQTALLPALIPGDLLAQANAAQQTLNQGLRLVTPLVGAGLFAAVGGSVVAEIDAGTFVIAAISLMLLRVDEPAPERGADRQATGTLTAGIRFLLNEPLLRPITLALAFAFLAIGFAESAIFSVVTVGLHHRATFVGVLMTIQGIGAVAGGLAAAWVLRRTSEGVMTSLALAGVTAGGLLLAAPALVPVLAGMVLVGVALPWINVAAITAIQRRTPAAMIGRVAGAFDVSLTVPQAISIGLGAALISAISYQALLVIIAVACAIAATYLISHTQARVSSEPLPAATPVVAAGPETEPPL